MSRHLRPELGRLVVLPLATISILTAVMKWNMSARSCWR
jgi:hypothetical protein